MALQTGIQASEKLKEIFSKCLSDDKVRTLKVVIKNESLECESLVQEQVSDFQSDFDLSLTGLVKDGESCYIFIRKSENTKDWIFVSFTPENSTVKEKMLYSSTRSTMKLEFGGTYICFEYSATTVDEVTLKGYLSAKESKEAPPPLTLAEQDLKDQDEHETKTLHGSQTRQQASGKLEFPLTNEAHNDVQLYKNNEVNYVELRVDTENEQIFSAGSSNITADEFSERLKEGKAGYHVFSFRHDHEGNSIKTELFIYFMPGYSVPIKERMLFSSCKNTLISYLETNMGLSFDKKLESSEADEFNEKNLYLEIHPPVQVARKSFAKPSAPGRKPRQATNRRLRQ